jgi:hypothetical protein
MVGPKKYLFLPLTKAVYLVYFVRTLQYGKEYDQRRNYHNSDKC